MPSLGLWRPSIGHENNYFNIALDMNTKTTLKDLYRYEGEKSYRLITRLRYILFTPGYQYSYCWRHASIAKNPISKLFWMILTRRCMFHSGIQIPVGTNIGPGLRISHFGSIVINPAAVIGKNFSIAQGALIGSAEGKHRGVPTIGDNVIMCANSMVVGGVHIGDYTMIAPGAFVNFDVPAHSIVIGNPGRIIPSDHPTDKYNVYKID